jgi:Flp pilus assembly protein TadG
LPVPPPGFNAGDELREAMMSRAKSRKETGQATVEFALTVIFVLILVFLTMELIVMFYTYSVLADAAKEGVRYAIVHGTGVGAANCSGPGGGGVTCTDSTGANVQTVTSNYANYSFHNSSAMVITPSYPDSSSVSPGRVRVTVSYAYQPMLGLGWPTVTVNAAAEGRIVF